MVLAIIHHIINRYSMYVEDIGIYCIEQRMSSDTLSQADIFYGFHIIYNGIGVRH